jgi:NAD(P)-dependent dehydrogenase (short-subunit alcohol dehydrogenase family)
MKPQEIEECIRVLEALVENRAGLSGVDEETRNRLLIAAGRVSRPSRTEQRLLARAVQKQKRQAARAADSATLERTGIRQKRAEPVFVTPEPLALAEAGGGFSDAAGWEEPELQNPRVCYVCKEPSSRVHFFYDQMCGPCGDFNYAKRSQTADLRGRVAIITGARVKIGYQAAMLLLRAGARVIVTTRFPRDAAVRYAREKDYETFKDRLQIYGLDLRHTPSVEAFARHIESVEERLDFLLHNACQTVRRPAGFYQHLMDAELGPITQLPAEARPLLSSYEAMRHAALASALGSGPGSPEAENVHAAVTTGAALNPLAVGLHAAPSLSQVPVAPEDLVGGQALFPAGQLDADLQQVDLREINSWRLPLAQVSTVELLEVQLVNAIAPFVLNARLKAMMLRQRTFDKHIVNVSAMEGQFYRRFKTDKHPHTNMAKAALNMMTRTSAPDYAKDGIYMNSVDTGWVTDEDPEHIARRKTTENGFHPPLDIVDGAARIVDPIFTGINTGRHAWGQFLKDYRPAAW